jgi:hypothetical protein
MDAAQTIEIRYTFEIEGKSNKIFDLCIDENTMLLRRTRSEPLPEWTELAFHQCPNCPLTPDRFPYCPVARNIVEIVEELDGLLSYDIVSLTVETDDRTVSCETSAQRGISSIMGLLIAVSECPLTDFFKPMARFHLPLANREETIWRATATYFLAQYFLRSRGYEMDLSLKGLANIYDKIETLNISMLDRLRAVSKRDSAINALIHLDVFAKYLAPSIEESIKKISHIIAPLVDVLTDPK